MLHDEKWMWWMSRGRGLSPASSRYFLTAIIIAASVQRSVLKMDTHVLEDAIFQASGLPVGQLGVGAACLSSALSYLLGAQSVLHACAQESGLRLLNAFAPCDTRDDSVASHRGSPRASARVSEMTKGMRPLRALGLTWALAQLALLQGNLKAMAPLVTACFLVAACLINLVSRATPVLRPITAASSELRPMGPTSRALTGLLHCRNLAAALCRRL